MLCLLMSERFIDISTNFHDLTRALYVSLAESSLAFIIRFDNLVLRIATKVLNYTYSCEILLKHLSDELCSNNKLKINLGIEWDFYTQSKSAA